MSAHRVLHELFAAPFRVADPGDAGTIQIDRDMLYCSLNPSTTETRTLAAPSKAGLEARIGTIATYTVVVTVLDSGASTTGTITLTTAGQWIVLKSFELSSGVYSWQATDVYGCTTTIQTAENWSAAVAAGSISSLVVATAISANSVLATNASIGTGLTAPSIKATNLSVSTAASIASILATNLSVGTGATIPNIVATSAMSLNSLLGTNASIGTGLTAPSIKATNLSVSTAASIASILATNISVGTGLTAPSIVCNTAISAASVLATNLSVGTGATIPNIVASSAMSLNSLLGTNVSIGAATITGNNVLGCGTVQVSGGTAAVDSQATALLTPVLNLISVGTATNNYFKLPTAAKGLCVNIVNLGSTAGLVGHTAGVSIASATSAALATANASGSAVNLVCDGTNWWHRAIA
jgi:hypothetical protein